MYPRYTVENIRTALADTPVVFVMGARQSGKTTLVKQLIAETGAADWTYITLDDQAQFTTASTDPVGFIRNLPGPRLALDEVQRVPALFSAIKQAVDERRAPGRFLLTGSANAFLLPRLSDSLAGRIEAVRLLPLSECELQGSQPSFLGKLLREEAPAAEQPRVRKHLIERLVSGCFPEPLQRRGEARQHAWHQQYLNSLIQRDLQDLPHIGQPKEVLNLLRLTALHSGKLVNLSQWSGKMDLSRETVKKYLALLEQLFLLDLLPGWHSNASKRLVKAPKMHLADTGMVCALSGQSRARLRQEPTLVGPLLETFVHNELRKQAAWLEKAGEPLRFHHYRDKDKVEVDLVMETLAGDCFAVEVKAAATLTKQDFTGLKRFQQLAGKRLRMGILLYDGDHTTSFGENLYAVPHAALWA